MYKLLTEEQKKAVEAEYKLRRIAVSLWALIAVILIGMVSLFPSYILTITRHKEVGERLKMIETQSLTAEEEEVQSWINGMNQKLRLLSPKFDDDRPSAFIEKALLTRTSGIRIMNIEWKREEGKEVLVLSGSARDRQSLISFEGKLNDSGSFGEVSLPISNLAKDKDIDFQVKLRQQ